MTHQPAVKATQFELATDGFPGSGLDVDDDPDTCAPSGNCNGGVDNALAPLATLMNDPMYQSVVDGSLIYVADLSEATPEVLAQSRSQRCATPSRAHMTSNRSSSPLMIHSE